MPGLIAAAGGGGIIEGDYTGWALKWSMTLTNGSYSASPPAFYIDEVNAIFYLWWHANSPRYNRFGTYNIADHSAIFESPSGSDYLVADPYTSGGGDYTFLMGCHGAEYSIFRSHQTYILLQRSDYFTIEVWKAGALLWTRDIRADTGEAWSQPRSIEISLTGKYILFWESETDKLMLYEGT